MTSTTQFEGGDSWIRSRLESGLSLSHEVLATLDRNALTTPAKVYLGSSASSARSLDPRYGGTGGRAPWDQVVQDITAHYSRANVIVEVALARPTDPLPLDTSMRWCFCQDEVYAYDEVRNGADAVERVLRSSDPSLPYLAAVVSTGKSEELHDIACPTTELSSGDLKLEMIIVGAFDGEGFVALKNMPRE